MKFRGWNCSSRKKSLSIKTKILRDHCANQIRNSKKKTRTRKRKQIYTMPLDRPMKRDRILIYMATALIHWTCIFLFKWIFLIIVLFAFSPSLNEKPVLEPESILTALFTAYTECFVYMYAVDAAKSPASINIQHSTFSIYILYT